MPNLVPCRSCGKLLDSAASRCPHCGAPLPSDKAVAEVANGCVMLGSSMVCGAIGFALLGCGGMVGGLIVGAVAGWLITTQTGKTKP